MMITASSFSHPGTRAQDEHDASSDDIPLAHHLRTPPIVPLDSPTRHHTMPPKRQGKRSNPRHNPQTPTHHTSLLASRKPQYHASISGVRASEPFAFFQSLLTYLLTHPESHDFRDPVLDMWSPEQAPNYLDKISHPMDLGTVQDNLNNDEYIRTNSAKYHRHYFDEMNCANDISLVFTNSMLYNQPSSRLYKIANRLYEYMNLQIAERETRLTDELEEAKDNEFERLEHTRHIHVKGEPEELAVEVKGETQGLKRVNRQTEVIMMNQRAELERKDRECQARLEQEVEKVRKQAEKAARKQRLEFETKERELKQHTARELDKAKREAYEAAENHKVQLKEADRAWKEELAKESAKMKETVNKLKHELVGKERDYQSRIAREIENVRKKADQAVRKQKEESIRLEESWNAAFIQEKKGRLEAEEKEKRLRLEMKRLEDNLQGKLVRERKKAREAKQATKMQMADGKKKEEEWEAKFAQEVENFRKQREDAARDWQKELERKKEEWHERMRHDTVQAVAGVVKEGLPAIAEALRKAREETVIMEQGVQAQLLRMRRNDERGC